MSVVERTESYRGYTITVEVDEYTEDPRKDFDHICTMRFHHKRYNLGDKQDMSPEEILKYVKRRDVIAMPVYMYDHSGLAFSVDSNRFSACDPQKWDWGLIGYITVTRNRAKKELGLKGRGALTSEQLERVYEVMRAEVKEYDQYHHNEVYCYRVTDYAGEEVKSCCGFYGDPEESGLLEEARRVVDAELKEIGEQTELSL